MPSVTSCPWATLHSFDETRRKNDCERVPLRHELHHFHVDESTVDEVHPRTADKAGHVQQIDSPMNLYDHPRNRFVAGFIGSPGMNFVDGTLIHVEVMQFVAEGNAFTVILPASLVERMEGYQGQEVTLGIRPEDVTVARESGPALFFGESTIVHPPITAPARLDLVEALGNEAFVYATVGAHSITARVAPQPLPDIGDP